MKRLLPILAVFAALISQTGAANAAPFTPLMWKAYNIATEYWGGPPPLCTSIDFEIVPHDSLDTPEEANVIGHATMPSEPGSCVLWIDKSIVAPVAFAELCVTVVHEDGHLHGLDHSPDPNNVMFWAPSAKSVPICIHKAHLMYKIIRHRELNRIEDVRSQTDARLTILRDAFWN